MTTLCIICDKPRRRSARGVLGITCGDPVCRAKASANVRFRPHENMVHWPVVTGKVVTDFAPHEVAARDGGYGFKIVRADDRSYTGCSAAYAAEGR